jgi:hypothetical protein
MARKVVLAVLFAMACAGVERAEAQGLRGWIDRLSGPGPFEGYGVLVEPVCYGVPQIPPPQDPVDRNLTLLGDCDRQHWRLDLGVEVSFYHANRNPLSYPDDPPNERREVDLRMVVPYVDLVPRPWIELGAGLGVAWFSGDLFDTNATLVIQPVRATVKPLVLLFGDKNPALTVLQLRGLLTIFPGGFDATDFGAEPGSWSVGTEVLPSWQIVIDASEWVFRTR